VRVDGKFLTILKREPDGSWKIRHIYFPRGRMEFIYSTAIW